MTPTTFALLFQDSGTQPAGGAPGAQPNLFESMGNLLVPILLCFGVFYFIILRPEKKQRALRQQMLASLKKGDKVLTTGGLYGSIVQVQDQVVTVQVADNVRMRMALSAIQSVEQEEAEKPVEAK